MLDSILLRIAKSAIVEKFDASYLFDKKRLIEEYPFLKQQGAID